MLQASRELLEAARKGQVQDVKALLLAGADPGAKDRDVSYSSCICIFGIDTAYIACDILLLIGAFSGSECHVHVYTLFSRTLQCMLLLQLYRQWCDPCVKRNCDAMPTCKACLLQGDTALHAAAKAGHIAVAKIMLLNGADIEASDNYVSHSSCICIIGIDTA